MRVANKWKEYECLDAGEGYKIERFGEYYLKRPEPTMTHRLKTKGIDFNAEYNNNEWIITDLPNAWILNYENMKLNLQLHEFKHLGVFPEQAVNWDFIIEAGKRHHEPIRVLNLFGYTGAATVAAALGNVEEVVHIDALKSAIKKTQENILLNNLSDKKIRTITEDVMKFLIREKKRGRTYHAIIMDPPSFGRGPKGTAWKIEEQLESLINACLDILDKDAIYLMLNTYTTNLSKDEVLKVLKKQFNDRNITHGTFDSQDIGVPITSGGVLTSGKTTRWCIYEDLL